MNKIDKYYKKCIYVWEYDNVLYWTKHKHSFLDCKTGYCNGGRVYYIPIDNKVYLGMDTLYKYINKLNHNENDNN